MTVNSNKRIKSVVFYQNFSQRNNNRGSYYQQTKMIDSTDGEETPSSEESTQDMQLSHRRHKSLNSRFGKALKSNSLALTLLIAISCPALFIQDVRSLPIMEPPSRKTAVNEAAQINASQPWNSITTALPQTQAQPQQHQYIQTASSTANQNLMFAPSVSATPKSQTMAQTTSSSLLDNMHIDYSAPKAHTSLFSQMVKEEDWETNFAQTKTGSQTINLAAIQPVSEPEINYAQISEQPAENEQVPAYVSVVDNVKTELTQQDVQPKETATLSQLTEPAWGAAVNDVLPKQSLAQVDVEAVAEAQQADINRLASLMQTSPPQVTMTQTAAQPAETLTALPQFTDPTPVSMAQTRLESAINLGSYGQQQFVDITTPAPEQQVQFVQIGTPSTEMNMVPVNAPEQLAQQNQQQIVIGTDQSFAQTTAAAAAPIAPLTFVDAQAPQINVAQVQSRSFAAAPIQEATVPVITPAQKQPMTLANIKKQSYGPTKNEFVQQQIQINEPFADEYFFSQVLPDTQTFTNTNKPHQLSFASKLHEFSNVIAVVLILAFAAVYKKKGCDLTGLFVQEQCLKQAVKELFVQTLIMIALAIAVIFSLHRMDLMADQFQMMLAADCCILIIGYQMLSGYRHISKAQQQIAIWRKYEENVINYAYLKLRKQQYEKQYYQLFLSQTQEIPMDLIDEIQYLTMRLQFINPVYLPVMTESFLCKEFNFAEYLAQVHSKTVIDFLNTHFIALALSLPIMTVFLVSLTSPEAIFTFLSLNSNSMAAWIVTAIPIVILLQVFGMFTKIKHDLDQIVKKLIPQILLEKREDIDEIEEQCGVPPPLRQPEALNFHRDITNSDIFSHFEELPIPDYLESARDQQFSDMFNLNQTRNSISGESNGNVLWSLLCCFSKSNSETFLNRHEKLFGRFKFSKDIVFVVLQTLQILMSICVSWTVIALVSGSITVANLWKDVSRRPEVYSLLAYLLLQVACIIISVVISLSGMQSTVRCYTFATSIEMLKNREVINEVLKQQKADKTARSYRVFQAMRQMRREYMQMVQIGGFNLNMSTSDTNSDYGEEAAKPQPAMSVTSEIQMPEEFNQKRLKDVAVKQILENFQKIGKPGGLDLSNEESIRRLSYRYTQAQNGNWAIDRENVEQLVEMCGGNLNKLESFYLLKRSCNGDQTCEQSTRDISCSDFTDAVESYINDVNADPYSMVLYLFKMKFGEGSDMLDLSDVKAFLQEFSSYFQGDDLDKFIQDIELGLGSDGEHVQVSHIAQMIKHAADGLPK